jgi:hypothetical protein
MGKNNVISENWKGRGSAEPLARGLNNLGRVINNVRGVNGIHAYIRGDRLVIEGQSRSSMDFSQFCFGFEIDEAVVTIKGGDWPIGEPVPLELADTDVTISQDLQYVGLEVDTINKTIAVIGPSVTKSFFYPDGNKFRCWLHQFNFSGGAVSLKRTRLGSLFMPSSFGAPP